MATDHYDVLGVEPDADPIIIKRRYRLLVRENHPDAVAPSLRESAHQQMLLINAAWTTLSDPAERARYDRSRQAAANSAARSPDSANGRTRVDGWVGGAGVTDSSQAHSAAEPSTHKRASPKSRNRYHARDSDGRRNHNPRTRSLTMVFEAAELYFFHGRADEAIAMCNQVLQFDAKNAEASALLGDILLEQGKRDLAVAAYERAVSNQPENALYRQKWEALSSSAHGIPTQAARSSSAANQNSSTSGGSAPSYGGAYHPGGRYGAKRGISARLAGAQKASGTNRVDVTSQNVIAPAADAQNGNGRRDFSRGDYSRIQAAAVAAAAASSAEISKQQRAAARRVASTKNLATLGYFLLVGAVILLASLMIFPPAEIAPWHGSGFSDPPLMMFAQVALAALFTGAALPLTSMVGSIFRLRPRQPPFAGVLLTGIAVLVAAVAFPLAVLFYVVCCVLWRSLHLPLLMVICVTLFLTCSLAAPFPGDNLPVLWQALLFWSGRAVFPAMAVGWFIGSLMRARS